MTDEESCRLQNFLERLEVMPAVAN